MPDLGEKRETMNLDEFLTMANDDGWDLDDPAQAVTLAAYAVGPNVKRIASFLGKPRSWCAEPARRLRDNKVWIGGKIGCESDDGPDSVELAVQSLVASGFLELARGA